MKEYIEIDRKIVYEFLNYEMKHTDIAIFWGCMFTLIPAPKICF